MTRYLTVTCSAAKCSAEGRVQLHGFTASTLPAGWHVVASSYDGGALEFCSLACIVNWAAAMQKAHASQRAWQAKPVPTKPIDAPVPEGAML